MPCTQKEPPGCAVQLPKAVTDLEGLGRLGLGARCGGVSSASRRSPAVRSCPGNQPRRAAKRQGPLTPVLGRMFDSLNFRLFPRVPLKVPHSPQRSRFH